MSKKSPETREEIIAVLNEKSLHLVACSASKFIVIGFNNKGKVFLGTIPLPCYYHRYGINVLATMSPFQHRERLWFRSNYLADMIPEEWIMAMRDLRDDHTLHLTPFNPETIPEIRS